MSDIKSIINIILGVSILGLGIYMEYRFPGLIPSMITGAGFILTGIYILFQNCYCGVCTSKK